MPSSLRDEALALPAEQRAELVEDLLASLEKDAAGVDISDIDRHWCAEMSRRSAQITTGEVETQTWDEVLSRVADNRRQRER